MSLICSSYLEIEDKFKLKILQKFINKIADYEFSLINLILDILKKRIVYDYFSKNKVEVWYCYDHDQGILVSSSTESQFDASRAYCHPQ